MKLLFLTSRFPYPVEKGDKLRAFYFIKHLSRYHDIYLFAINDQLPGEASLNKLQPYCKAIHVETITTLQSVIQMLLATTGDIPFQVAYFSSERAKKKLKIFVNKYEPEKVFCHLIRMAEYADVVTGSSGTIDYMDAFSKGVERLKEHSVWWKSVPLMMEEKRLKKYESKVFDRFRNHIIISKQDREFINHPQRKAISVIPNGVEFEYYSPRQSEKKYDLLFIGNMAYPPNIEAAMYAAKKILPLVHKQNPNITFLIAGATPVAQVRKLQTDKIKVSGWVDDVPGVFSSSRIMIAPMLISIGLQNKILQAMAMKIPCVISRLANNAIGAPENCVLVANHPQEYASQILDLLNDPSKANRMAENAYDFVKLNFDWEKNIAGIKQLI